MATNQIPVGLSTRTATTFQIAANTLTLNAASANVTLTTTGSTFINMVNNTVNKIVTCNGILTKNNGMLHYRRSTQQNFTASAETLMAFDTAEETSYTGTLGTTTTVSGTDNTRWTNSSGHSQDWLVCCNFFGSTVSLGLVMRQFNSSNTQLAFWKIGDDSASNQEHTMSIITTMANGDYIQMYAYNANGTTQSDYVAYPPYSTFLRITALSI